MLSRMSLPRLHERLWFALRRWAVAWGRIVYLGAVVLVLALTPSSYTRSARRSLAPHI